MVKLLKLLSISIFIAIASLILYSHLNIELSWLSTPQVIAEEHHIVLTNNLETLQDTLDRTLIEYENIRLLELEAKKKTIVIDPGHQAKGNYDQEPDGPGSSTTKAKVTSGTSGRFSGLTEHELNLNVSLLLQSILEDAGHTVIMIRTTADVDISNSERAMIANDADADAFIRIHADGSENANAQGAMTICPTPNNKYEIGALYDECRLLSELVLDAMVEETGFKKRNVWETDTMSGINWCEVPVTIVEMGFMTNKEEDTKMATQEYQQKFAQGIANGLYNYFESFE